MPRTLPQFMEHTERLIKTLLGSKTLRAIGLGIPGITEPSGTVWVPNCPALHGVNVVDALLTRFRVPVIVENDAQLALWAEFQRGYAQGLHHVLLVAVGTGIGGSIMLDGRIVRGQHGSAGAFGWLRMSNLEQWTTWEQIASGRALDTMAEDLGLVGGGPALVDQARRGHGASRNALDIWVNTLGNGMAALSSIFDPEMILVSGGIIRDQDMILPRLRDIVQRQTSPMSQCVRIEPAFLGHQAVVWGAILKVEEYQAPYERGNDDVYRA